MRVKSRGSACGTRVEGTRIGVEGLGCQSVRVHALEFRGRSRDQGVSIDSHEGIPQNWAGPPSLKQQDASDVGSYTRLRKGTHHVESPACPI